MSRALPSGRVTFAFTDVVGSTRTFIEHGHAYVEAVQEVQARVAQHAHDHGGVVVSTEGDGAMLAFSRAQDALAALRALQDEVERTEGGLRLRLRAGAHTGDAEPIGDLYVALPVYVAARVSATAGAGQVIVSQAVIDELEEPVGQMLGAYALKDVAEPMTLWRVSGDDTPPRAVLARRTNVADPHTSFVGRGAEMQELHELVSGTPGLVTVVGPGGLGKTRLVSEYALGHRDQMPAGIWLVELASISDPDALVPEIASTFGLPGVASLDTVIGELRRRGEVVLILDNCEHLLDHVAETAANLLRACPALRLLCTSREPLQVPGERVWSLSPLEEEARVELFTQRARAGGGTVPDGSDDAIDRLCAALDGLPLAIELAATHSGSTPLKELIRIAELGTDDLARRGGQSRQRSLDAVLAWSLERLPPTRRASLLVLSTLPGRFDLEMATTILEAVEACEADAVRHLARASLIDLDGVDYRILDTIRHAARRQLATDPDLAAAARLGLRTWAQGRAAALYKVRTREPLDAMADDQVLALETALEEATRDCATGLGKLWELVRMISHFREPSTRVLNLAEQLLDGPLPHDSDQDLCFNAALHLHVVTKVEALPIPDDRLEAICAAADEHGVSDGSGFLHYNAAWQFASRGDLDAARRHADACLPFATRPEADSFERRTIHQIRYFVAYAAGALDEALVHAERVLHEVKESGSDLDRDVGECNVAEILLDLGRPDEALPHALEAARLAPPLPGPERRAILLVLARAHDQLGNSEAALATAREIEVELLASGRPDGYVAAELARLRELVPGRTTALTPTDGS